MVFLIVLVTEKRIQLVCEKLTIFCMDNMSLASLFCAVFKKIDCYDIDVGI